MTEGINKGERIPNECFTVANFQHMLESRRNRFTHQGWNGLETGSINLPGRVKASRQKAKASFFQVLLGGMQSESMGQI